MQYSTFMSDELELLPEEPNRRDRDLPAHPLYGGGPLEPSEALGDDERCANHPHAKAHGVCAACQTRICGSCRILSQGRVLCLACRGSQGWRAPVLLRLAIAAGWVTLALSATHRALVLRPPLERAPLLPDGWAGLPPAVTAATHWGAIQDGARAAVGYGQMVAVGVVLVALLFARSSEAQTGRLAWRVGLACLLGGASVVLAADAPSAWLFAQLF